LLCASGQSSAIKVPLSKVEGRLQSLNEAEITCLLRAFDQKPLANRAW
jgi:hypothetical protein